MGLAFESGGAQAAAPNIYDKEKIMRNTKASKLKWLSLLLAVVFSLSVFAACTPEDEPGGGVLKTLLRKRRICITP